MDDAIKKIERTAHVQAKRAARMWIECRQLLEASADEDKIAAITAALELNHRAIEQARESINRFDFVRRYRLSPQAHAN